jgi:hypothetical protein
MEAAVGDGLGAAAAAAELPSGPDRDRAEHRRPVNSVTRAVARQAAALAAAWRGLRARLGEGMKEKGRTERWGAGGMPDSKVG